MNIHKNARLTLARRLELVLDITVRGVSPSQAALTHGVSAPTARKWLGRYLAMGCDGLTDASSRPALSPKAISAAKALAIVELRRKRLTQARIAAALGVAKSTVSRVLAPWRPFPAERLTCRAARADVPLIRVALNSGVQSHRQ